MTDPRALPAPWCQARDAASQVLYYYNPATGERQWREPDGTGPRTLPPGWSFAVDVQYGAKYYFHRQSGKSQWAEPDASTAVEEEAVTGPLFEAAEAFGGRKAGYVFKSGVAGLGYYLDTPGAGEGKRGGAWSGMGWAYAVEGAGGMAVGECEEARRETSL